MASRNLSSASDPGGHLPCCPGSVHDSPCKKAAFHGLTPGRQKGYLLYFSSAEKSETREARVEKCIPRIIVEDVVLRKSVPPDRNDGWPAASAKSSIVIIEVKRSDQAARQALFEILKYMPLFQRFTAP
jgi:hypothetical protein